MDRKILEMKNIDFNNNNINKFKSIYMCVSGGTDSALLLFLISKHISENNFDISITPATGIEPQPDFVRNDWYVERIVNIIRNLFPNVTIRDPLFTYFQGYTTQEKITFPKCDLMRNMNTNNILNGDYDLCIDALSSIPDFKEIETDEKFLERAKSIGPEDRQYTGKKNDKMLISNRKNKNNKQVYWWQPFINFTKKDFAVLYEHHNLMENLFPYTASCTGNAKDTNNFTEPCQQCFWCLEKYWAFNLFDYPKKLLK